MAKEIAENQRGQPMDEQALSELQESYLNYLHKLDQEELEIEFHDLASDQTSDLLSYRSREELIDCLFDSFCARSFAEYYERERSVPEWILRKLAI